MSTEIISIVFLFLGGFGVIASFLIIAFYHKSWCCVLMGGLFCLLSYDMFVLRYVQNGLYSLYPNLLFTNWAIPFVYGPLLYFAYLLKYKGFGKIKFFTFLYFIPFVIIVLINFSIMFQGAVKKLEIYNEFIGLDLPYVFLDLEWFGQMIYNLCFYFLTWFTFKKSFGNKFERNTVLIFAGLALIYTATAMVFEFGNNVFNYYNVFVSVEWVLLLLLVINNIKQYNIPN